MADRLEIIQTRAFSALNKLERGYERQVMQILKDALDEMRSVMGGIYEKYSVAGVLTKAEMTRYNRLSTLEAQMLSIITPAAKSGLKVIDRLRPEQYQAAFFRNAWAIDNSSGIRIAWGTLSTEQILANLENEFYAIAKAGYTQAQQIGIRTVINQGLAQGKSYPDMIKGLRSHIDKANWQILRILRTENQAAVNGGANKTYETAGARGIDGKKVWIATLDGSTRDDHAAMDGVAANEEGDFRLPDGETAPYPGWGGLSAAERINCRCTVRYEIDGFSPAIRRSRDSGVIEYQDYEKWLSTRK